MERENDDGPDHKAARNVASALIHEKNPLESPVLRARAAFFRSLLDDLPTADVPSLGLDSLHFTTSIHDGGMR